MSDTTKTPLASLACVIDGVLADKIGAINMHRLADVIATMARCEARLIVSGNTEFHKEKVYEGKAGSAAFSAGVCESQDVLPAKILVALCKQGDVTVGKDGLISTGPINLEELAAKLLGD